MDAPSLEELYEVLHLAQLANQGKKQYPIGKSTVALEKMAKWLYDLGKMESDASAAVRLALETAENYRPIEGILAVSTSHVTKETAKLLSDFYPPLTKYDHGGHGWLIYVSYEDDDCSWQEAGVPSELVNLLTYTRKCGCCWLLLDADASEVDGLPTFVW